MPKEIYPSSYLCDCGYQSDFFENMVKEMKQESFRRPQRLGSDDGKHVVVFKGGEMAAMWCPDVGRDIAANAPSQRIAHQRRVRKGQRWRKDEMTERWRTCRQSINRGLTRGSDSICPTRTSRWRGNWG